METIIDHVLAGLALLFAAAASWFARKASKPNRQQDGEALARLSVDYGLAHPQPGITLERTALDAWRLGDLKDNGKRDFSDAQAMVFIRAEIARRGK